VKIIYGAIASTFLMMGIFLLALALLTLRLYHLSLIGVVKVTESYGEIHTYGLLGIFMLLIGFVITVRNKDW
jgi:hypothetical protein